MCLAVRPMTKAQPLVMQKTFQVKVDHAWHVALLCCSSQTPVRIPWNVLPVGWHKAVKHIAQSASKAVLTCLQLNACQQLASHHNIHS